jgi:hypothetical protein
LQQREIYLKSEEEIAVSSRAFGALDEFLFLTAKKRNQKKAAPAFWFL